MSDDKITLTWLLLFCLAAAVFQTLTFATPKAATAEHRPRGALVGLFDVEDIRPILAEAC